MSAADQAHLIHAADVRLFIGRTPDAMHRIAASADGATAAMQGFGVTIERSGFMPVREFKRLFAWVLVPAINRKRHARKRAVLACLRR